MAGLQRSTTSFRRQGSSGLIWDDKLLTASGELVQLTNPREEEEEEVKPKLKVSVPSKTGGSIERSRSNQGFRTGKVSPAIEPPSPKVSACGFCNAFGKNNEKSNRRPKSGKRKM
ncbi:hypothetical protein RND71_017446 [Anisodus tanguticus]|uniref:Uncharacterized protein n=1 Tax=Anisodus tanguticus TaxID=243964 RepID=A0AAE1S2E6_9SOLA|nr:hypothetical protein RND71_017446 [Anisodus tanguticus]